MKPDNDQLDQLIRRSMTKAARIRGKDGETVLVSALRREIEENVGGFVTAASTLIHGPGGSCTSGRQESDCKARHSTIGILG
ncbi:MAG: hypothetical protein J5J06_17840 [Phycisphaerae bacterium]|nr:hypothetical protein [Phycisphaerae bacterium]